MPERIKEESEWISLMDYATQYGVSLSTLRRYIKANKIQFKVENGRYLLAPRSEAAGATVAPLARPTTPAAAESDSNLDDLKLRLSRAQEEISELKMLVDLYEDQLSRLRSGQPRSNDH